MVRNLPATWETKAQSLSREDPLEKGPTTRSSILACRTPWTEEPGRLQSMGSQRVRHNWVTNTHTHTHTHTDRCRQIQINIDRYRIGSRDYGDWQVQNLGVRWQAEVPREEPVQVWRPFVQNSFLLRGRWSFVLGRPSTDWMRPSTLRRAIYFTQSPPTCTLISLKTPSEKYPN